MSLDQPRFTQNTEDPSVHFEVADWRVYCTYDYKLNKFSRCDNFIIVLILFLISCYKNLQACYDLVYIYVTYSNLRYFLSLQIQRLNFLQTYWYWYFMFRWGQEGLLWKFTMDYEKEQRYNRQIKGEK